MSTSRGERMAAHIQDHAAFGITPSPAKRYGIKNSTTLDQTIQFQAMVNDTVYAGAHFELPYGEIHIDGNIDLDQGLNFGFWPSHETLTSGVSGPTIRGQGGFATRIIQEGVGGRIRAFESGASARQKNGLTLGGFALIGPGLDNVNNVGIQLGGVSTDASDIIEGTKLFDLRIINFSTALALDDCTSVLLERVCLEGYNYGIEFGFNTDNIQIIGGRFGSVNAPIGYTATTASGDATVTLTGGWTTTTLRVGMRVKGANIPYGTTILSITDTTHFEASANATGTGADTLYFSQGIALSCGRGSFVGAWPAASTGPGNGVLIQTTWFMRNAETLAIETGAKCSNIKFDTCYYESNNRIATLGSAGATSSAYYAIWDNCHFSQTNLACKDYAIYEDGAAGVVGNIVLRNNRCDGNSVVPWVRLRGASSTLDWDNNTLSVASGAKIHVYDSAISFSPANGSKWMYGLPGANKEVTTLGVTGAMTPLIPSKVDCIIKIGPMTGNVTVANPSLTYASEGQRVRFTIVEDATAGHTVSFGTSYHLTTAWTNSVVTTDASKRTYIEFECTAAAGVFIQVSPANVWAA